jgi:hypothetical protein
MKKILTVLVLAVFVVVGFVSLASADKTLLAPAGKRSVTTNAETQYSNFRLGITILQADTAGAKLIVSGGGFAAGDPIIGVFDIDSLANSATFAAVVNPDSAWQSSDTLQVLGAISGTGGRYIIFFVRK